MWFFQKIQTVKSGETVKVTLLTSIIHPTWAASAGLEGSALADNSLDYCCGLFRSENGHNVGQFLNDEIILRFTNVWHTITLSDSCVGVGR